ncbi:MAG: sigma-70 family RNA polymerase sigma factor [Duncaniella sp.]|nr:sigma-70 family RNA polymerase sigma factor [Duncaniella sp.]MDE5673405.1 sigma-70 family RNA polymerase sigma factor [Duncaniella sp.]MDE6186976.1 sigma-70 family RNA polymerase sigma factor [Duncaniella sp.]
MVYSRYIRILTAVCSRYLLEEEDMKDVLQESFIKIFASIGDFCFRGEGSLKAWMIKVVVNESLKFIRKSTRIDFTEVTDQHADMPDEEPEVDTIPSEVIYGFIRQLPDGYRMIFNLYVVEGRSHKEISGLLGIKESTSASQLHRAKAILAEKIRSYQKECQLIRN